MKFQLFTQVALRQDIPELNLTKGSIGTVVEYYPMPAGKEDGYSLEGLIPQDTVEVSESQIRALKIPKRFKRRTDSHQRIITALGHSRRNLSRRKPSSKGTQHK